MKERISITLDGDLLKYIQEKSKQERKTLSAMINEIILQLSSSGVINGTNLKP